MSASAGFFLTGYWPGRAVLTVMIVAALAATPHVDAFSAPGGRLCSPRGSSSSAVSIQSGSSALVPSFSLIGLTRWPPRCASFSHEEGAADVRERGRLRLVCALSASRMEIADDGSEERRGKAQDLGLQGGGWQPNAAMQRPGDQGWGTSAAERSVQQAMKRPGDSPDRASPSNNRMASQSRFPMLSGFTTVESLLNATMPLLQEKVERIRAESRDLRSGVRAADAVNMMNRLKQMTRDVRRGQAMDVRVVAAMEMCAELTLGSMRGMHPKHVALALNAIKDRSWPLFSPLEPSGPGGVYDQLYAESIDRAISLLQPAGGWSSGAGRDVSDTQNDSMPAQTLAMILNAAAIPDSSGEERGRIGELFALASGYLQKLGDASADAHSAATVVNSYASQGIWDASLFRCVCNRVCSMPKEVFTLQSVGMILNSHSRFLERQSTWDVTESDAELFVAMSEATVWLCRGQRLDKMSAGKASGMVRSLTLIVNAFAKVGMPDKDLFESVAKVLRSAQWVSARGVESGSRLFDAQSVANLMNAYAKAGMLDLDIFKCLSTEAQALDPHRFEVQHIANILNSAVKGGHKDDRLFMRMKQALIKAGSRGMSAQAVALVLNAFARAGLQDDVLYSHMSSMIMHISDRANSSLSPQCVANILNACAAGNFRDEYLLKRLSAVCMSMNASEAILHRHIGNILNAFVRLDHNDENVFRHLAGLFKQMPGASVDAQSISLIANAFAKTGYTDLELFKLISQQAQALKSDSYGPQSLAVLANAFSKSGVKDHGLFRRLCELTLMQPEDSFDEQSIANLVNAFSKNCISWPKHKNQAPSAWFQLQAMMRKLARVLLRMPPSSFTAQGVALVVNAYAKMHREGLVLETLKNGGEDVGFNLLFSHMGSVAVQMGSRCFELPCDAQHVSNIVNAYAKANIANVELFDHLSRVAQGMGRDAFDAQNVANILHAYATLGIRDEQLFAWMSQVARSYEPGHFDAQHISNIIHSLAVLGIEDSQLVAHLFNNVLRSRQTSLFQKDFNPQAMANLAWGVAVLEVRDTQIHSWIASSCASKIGEMDKNALSQLHQFLLSCELQGLHGTSDRIISDLGAHRDVIRDAFDGGAVSLGKAISEGRRGASTLQRDVAFTLKAIGAIDVQEEFSEPSTGYSVDIRVPNTSIVIEVDGPTHYSLGGHDPLGHTKIKRRHLSALGYTLLTVPYWRWYHGLSREAKCRRLRGVIYRQLSERGADFAGRDEVEHMIGLFDEHRIRGELNLAENRLNGPTSESHKVHLERKTNGLKVELEKFTANRQG